MQAQINARIPAEDEPVLVAAKTGFSVFYRERYLYSKYQPEKSILQALESLWQTPDALKQRTLILCFSPVLCLGLSELAEKMPPDCALFLIETDRNLFDFSLPFYKKLCEDSTPDSPFFYFDLSANNAVKKFASLFEAENGCDSFGEKLPPLYSFKRTLRFDFSAGVSFSPEVYSNIQKAADSSISQFWKNRITLLRLGRLFSTNVFKNLKEIPESSTLIQHCIEKPILVIGAGPSLDAIFARLEERSGKTASFFAQFFVLAVDTAISALIGRKIKIDAIVQVESQWAVNKAYYDASCTQIPVLLDLSGRSQSAHITGGECAYFFSPFTQSAFLHRIADIGALPLVMQPMGSVGLAATYLALVLRKTDNVKIFVLALDFAFPPAKTHCKNSPHLTERLASTTRISPVEDVSGAFVHGSVPLDESKSAYTYPALAGYAASFCAIFGSTKNLFDAVPEKQNAKKYKLPLGIPQISIDEMLDEILDEVSDKVSIDEIEKTIFLEKYTSEKTSKASANIAKKIEQFYQTETSALEELAHLLSGEKQMSEAERSEKIYALLREREYLFLHFPDGYILTRENLLEVSFLKRVKAEIGFFLKVLQSVGSFGQTVHSTG